MEISSIFNKNCKNYRGKFLFQSLPEVGSIQSVLIQVPQKFHRFHAAKFRFDDDDDDNDDYNDDDDDSGIDDF